MVEVSYTRSRRVALLRPAWVVAARRLAPLTLDLTRHLPFGGTVGVDEEMQAAALLQDFLRPPKLDRVLRAEAELQERAQIERFTLRPGTENPEERIQWYRWGKSGKRVLLVHGWGGRATQFTALVPALLHGGYQVIGFDAPAHGASSGEFASGPSEARAARYTAERAGAPYAVIAHSLGASAAAIALAQGLPAEKAIMLAPLADVLPSLRAFAAHHAAGEKVRAALLRRFAERYPEGAISPCLLAAGFRVAGLIFHDPDDPEVPVGHGRALAEAWPGCRFEIQPGVGHWRILRAREVIDKALAFLQESGS